MLRTKSAAAVSTLTSVFAAGYVAAAPTIVSETFTTPEDVTLHVTAPGVAAGGSDISGVVAYQFGSPSSGTFQGLTTIDGVSMSSANGSFAFVPPSGFTGTVNFVVQGVISDTATSFNGTDAVTDHIVVTAGTPPPPPTTGVPETSTLALLVGGLAALGVVRSRRRTAAER